ncbi:MAG: hypothetical protein ACP5NZ_00555 [Nanobdellota archaeon]
MRGELKITLMFLFIILFIGNVYAYNSFFLVKEDRESSKALIVYDVDYTEIMKKYDTIISLNKKEGDFNDFNDLINYLKESKITNVVYYRVDDINEDLVKLIKIEAGVVVRVLNDEGVRNLGRINTENTNDAKQSELIIMGKSIAGENLSRNSNRLWGVIIGIIFIILVIAFLIPRKKRRLKNN